MMKARGRHTCSEPGCGKAFSSPSHLRRHVRNHRNDRAYSCVHCGQSFVRREVWKRHEALHLEPQSSRPRIKPIKRESVETKVNVEPASSESTMTGPPSSSATKAEMPQSHRESDFSVSGHRESDFSIGGGGHRESDLSLSGHRESDLSLSGHRESDFSQGYTPERGRLDSVSSMPRSMLSTLASSSSYDAVQLQQYSWPPRRPQEGRLSESTQTTSNPSNQTFTPVQAVQDADANMFHLGIEGWLDQILIDQATFAGFAVPPVSPYNIVPNVSFNAAQDPVLAKMPSSVEEEACARIAKWLGEEGPKYAFLEVSPEKLSQRLGAYWTHIDPQYPVIHRATFSPLDATPLLLLVMVILGATASGADDEWAWAEEAFPLAVPLVFSACSVDQNNRLNLLQAGTLLSIAGHGMDQEAQDHAHALVSFLLTIARRANLFEDRSHPSSRSGELDAQWSRWIIDESFRRIAWVILVRDIEYASFFQQLPSRAMSVFLLPVDLPCSEYSWDAANSAVWSASLVPGETLAAALKRVIQSGPGSAPQHSPKVPADTDFAQLVLTYGLTALGWDVNRRNLIAPEISKSGPTALNTFLVRAFSYPVHEDIHPHPRNQKQESLQRCIQDTSFLSAIGLHVDIMLLQVFCGVPEIGTFQPVRPTDTIEASKYIHKWVKSAKSSDAVSLSTEFLAKAIRHDQVSTLNHAWAIYMAFLVGWAYYILVRRNSSEAPYEQRNSINNKEGAIRCCEALKIWARNRDPRAEPDPALMTRALGTQVVLLLSTRQEVMVKAACMVVDRNIVTY